MGSGAAKAVATVKIEKGASPAVATPEVSSTFCDFPADPDDVRLTLKGLVVDGSGKVKISGYEDLLPHFAGEPAPDLHPNPEKPGVRLGDSVPKSLRMWDDVRAGNTCKDGAGWIAVRGANQHEKKQEKWFNIRVCGSWRMAFLLARLQLLHWDEHAPPAILDPNHVDFKRVSRNKTRLKIGKGRLGKWLVFSGRRFRTVGGLRSKDLIRNKRGKIVSKKRAKRGTEVFGQIKQWLSCFMSVRTSLKVNGFVAINGKGALGKGIYNKTKEMYIAAGGSLKVKEEILGPDQPQITRWFTKTEQKSPSKKPAEEAFPVNA